MVVTSFKFSSSLSLREPEVINFSSPRSLSCKHCIFLENTRINRCATCPPGKWVVRLFPGLINCKSFH